MDFKRARLSDLMALHTTVSIGKNQWEMTHSLYPNMRGVIFYFEQYETCMGNTTKQIGYAWALFVNWELKLQEVWHAKNLWDAEARIKEAMQAYERTYKELLGRKLGA